MKTLAQMFPPLYECSKCGASVKVTPLGEGIEPRKEFPCGHDDAIIWANRSVTLRGVGAMEAMPMPQRVAIRVTLKLRDILSHLTGRSI